MIDAVDLKKEPVPDFEFLPLLNSTEPYIIKGFSTIISAAPKCGKTELIYPCLAKWMNMGETILYFTEEPEIVWQDRLKAIDIVGRPGLMIVFAMGMSLETMLQIARDGEETVVILDTLGGLRLLGDDRNHNEGVAKAMEPWLLTCREGNKNLLALTHNRKGGGSQGEGVSGGTSLIASVDMVLEIQRVKKKPMHRRVSAIGRRVQPKSMVYERLEDGTMKVVKEYTADEIKTLITGKKSNDEIRNHLPTLPEGITTEQLAKLAGVRKQQAIDAIAEGEKKGCVGRKGGGVKGDPNLYYKT
jgi:hypothetical protein